MDDSSESTGSFRATVAAPHDVRPSTVQRWNAGNQVDSTMSRNDWKTVVMNAFAANTATPATLTYPWERGVVSAVFSDRVLPSFPAAVPSTSVDLRVETTDPFALSMETSQIVLLQRRRYEHCLAPSLQTQF